MRFAIALPGLVVGMAVLGGAIRDARGQLHANNVPPTLEIEVLDPNADPLGRPAVELARDEHGNLIVDVPPVVLVHCYYFTGERSFQAQLLPGGPSIVAVNHPKTGERCYIEVQMPPGAPRVTYRDHGIVYDYGDTAISIVFGLFGNPSVKYRTGLPLHRQASNLLHVDQVKQHFDTAREYVAATAEQRKMQAYGALVTVGETANQMILPARNLLEILPFGKIIFDPNRGQKLIETAAQHRREARIKRQEKQQRLGDTSLPTIR